MTCLSAKFCEHAKDCDIHMCSNTIEKCRAFNRKPNNNEEYLKSCTTEMLAVAIFKAICISAEMIHCEITLENRSGTELKEAIYEWLQQPHREE